MTPPRPAERLLLALGIDRPEDIDLEAIAWTAGAAVKYRPLDRCEAMIVGSKDRAIIAVNSNALPVRQRFSLAHEIGHWHHHRGRVLVCRSEDIGNPAPRALDPEKEADGFASDLLLPDYLVRPRIRAMDRVTLSEVRALAKEFSTSVTAALLKIVESNGFPLLAVCHDRNRRRWFRRAPGVAGWWFPREHLDVESFAFEMLYGNAAESRFPRKIGADAWFDFRHAGRFELLEQSYLLPNSEILTMLVLPDEAME